MARARYVRPERRPWRKWPTGRCVTLILLVELALMSLAIVYNPTNGFLPIVALLLVGCWTSFWMGGGKVLKFVAALAPLLVLYLSAKATGDIVMHARGEVVVAQVLKVDISTDKSGDADYSYELAQLDGTAIPGYLGNYSGPVMKLGQPITVIVDPAGFAMPRPPGTMNPTWWLIFDALSVTLLTGALVLGVPRRAQAHGAPDPILRKT